MRESDQVRQIIAFTGDLTAKHYVVTQELSGDALLAPLFLRTADCVMQFSN